MGAFPCRDSWQRNSRYICKISHTSSQCPKTKPQRHFIQLKALDTWQKIWSNVPITNKLRIIIPFTKKWNFQHNLKRKDKVIISWVRIDRTYLTHSSHIFALSLIRPWKRIGLSQRKKIVVEGIYYINYWLPEWLNIYGKK